MLALVHGLGCTHRYWSRLHALLPDALCPDLHGDSVTTLADELDGLVPAGVLLVANSLGCEVAVELALRRPGRVRGLVLVGPTVDAGRRRFASQLCRLAADSAREPLDLLLLLLRDYSTWGARRLARTAASMLRDPIETKLPLVDVPAVVVRGARDPICPQDWCVRAAGLLPQGRLVVVPDAAHAVHWSRPGAVARVVEEVQQQLGER